MQPSLPPGETKMDMNDLLLGAGSPCLKEAVISNLAKVLTTEDRVTFKNAADSELLKSLCG